MRKCQWWTLEPSKPYSDSVLKYSGWLNGYLRFLLKEYQKPVYDLIEEAQARRVVFNCARRWGKSYLMCVLALEAAIKNPRWNIRFVTAYAKDMTEILLPLMSKLCENAPPQVRPKRIANTGQYRFPNGSNIWIFGADSGGADSARGKDTNLYLVDEAGHIANLEYLVESIISPALLSSAALGAGGHVIMASTPGVSPDHPFRTYYFEALAEGRAVKQTIHDTEYPAEIIAEFAKEAGGEHTTAWRREYLAEFVGEEDRLVVPEFTPERNIWDGKRPDYFDFLHRYVSVDVGARDLTVGLFGYYDFQAATLVIEAERVIKGPKMVTNDVVALIREAEASLWGALPVNYRVADDITGFLVNDLTRLHGLPTAKPTKGQGSREAGVNEVRAWMRDGRIRISPDCKLLINTLEAGIWDKNRKDFERMRNLGHLDAIAALSYMVRTVDCQTNPIPENFGKSKQQMFNDELVRKSRGEDVNYLRDKLLYPPGFHDRFKPSRKILGR